MLPRLLLLPGGPKPLDYREDDPDDLAAWKHKPDGDAHVTHALLLTAAATPGRPLTVPRDAAWPVPAAVREL